MSHDVENEELQDRRARKTIANRIVIATTTFVIRRRLRETIDEELLLPFVINPFIGIRRDQFQTAEEDESCAEYERDISMHSNVRDSFDHVDADAFSLSMNEQELSHQGLQERCFRTWICSKKKEK